MKKQEIYDLIKEKELLKTEDDDFDFSSFDNQVTNGGTSTDNTTSTDTSTDTPDNTTDTTNDTTDDTKNDNMDDLFDGDDNSGDFMGGGSIGGMGPTLDNNDNENISDELKNNKDIPEYKILDLVYNEENPDKIKVKVKDKVTGKIKIKDLNELII